MCCVVLMKIFESRRKHGTRSAEITMTGEPYEWGRKTSELLVSKWNMRVTITGWRTLCRCYKCGSFDGHKMRECQNEMKCRKCGQGGHKQDDCTTEKDEGKCTYCGKEHEQKNCDQMREDKRKQIREEKKEGYLKEGQNWTDVAREGEKKEQDRKKEEDVKTRNEEGAELRKSIIDEVKEMMKAEKEERKKEDEKRKKEQDTELKKLTMELMKEMNKGITDMWKEQADAQAAQVKKMTTDMTTMLTTMIQATMKTTMNAMMDKMSTTMNAQRGGEVGSSMNPENGNQVQQYGTVQTREEVGTGESSGESSGLVPRSTGRSTQGDGAITQGILGKKNLDNKQDEKGIGKKIKN